MYQKRNMQILHLQVFQHIHDILVFFHFDGMGHIHPHAVGFHPAQCHTIQGIRKYTFQLLLRTWFDRYLQSGLQNHPHAYGQKGNYIKQFVHHQGVIPLLGWVQSAP